METCSIETSVDFQRTTRAVDVYTFCVRCRETQETDRLKLKPVYLGIWGPWPYSYYCLTMWVSCCETPSLTRGRVCKLFLQLLLGLASAVTSGPSPAYCLTWDSSSPEGQVPVFMLPRNILAQLYPPAVGSPYVAAYDSQGYGRDILTCLHTVWRL
jgi:hypothetical protein